MDVVSEQQIRDALGKRKHDIADNLETLTLKRLRQELAEDLRVDESAIKEHKDFLVKAVDEIVAWAHKRTKSNADVGKDTDENKSPSNKRARKNTPSTKNPASSPARHKKAPKQPAAPKASTNSAVQKLKDMCKDATITIPPALYKRASDTDELVQELEALLDKHGLTRSSGPRDVAAVKAKLNKEKELEGIDLGNIIEDTGRRRRGAAAAVDYKKMAHVSTSDEEEEGDDSDESDVEDGSEEEDAEGAAAAEDTEGDKDAEPVATGNSEEVDLEDNVPEGDVQPVKKGKRAVMLGTSDEDDL